jgi:hypothetical protein
MQSNARDAGLGGRTQALFRDVNERVREINDAFSGLVPLGEWICECADQSCAERIALTPEEYEAVRSKPTWFAVAPGDVHVFAAIEEVVARYDRYWIVEKEGIAAELVSKVDPRRVGLRGDGKSSRSRKQLKEPSRRGAAMGEDHGFEATGS